MKILYFPSKLCAQIFPQGRGYFLGLLYSIAIVYPFFSKSLKNNENSEWNFCLAGIKRGWFDVKYLMDVWDLAYIPTIDIQRLRWMYKQFIGMCDQLLPVVQS